MRSFSSAPNELLGHYVSISEHAGHALTYKSYAKDSQTILHCSAIWTATAPKTWNIRAEGNDDFYPYIQSHIYNTINESQDRENNTMPIVNPEDLAGCTYGITSADGQDDKFKLWRQLRGMQHTQEVPLLPYSSNVPSMRGAHEEVMSYNDIMEYLKHDRNIKVMRKFKSIYAYYDLHN